MSAPARRVKAGDRKVSYEPYTFTEDEAAKHNAALDAKEAEEAKTSAATPLARRAAEETAAPVAVTAVAPAQTVATLDDVLRAIEALPAALAAELKRLANEESNG